MDKYLEEKTQSSKLDRQKMVKEMSRENPTKPSWERTFRSPDKVSKVSRENVKKVIHKDKKESRETPSKVSKERESKPAVSKERESKPGVSKEKESKPVVVRESRETTMRTPDKISRICDLKVTQQEEELKSVKMADTSKKSESRYTKAKTAQRSKEPKKSKEPSKISELTKKSKEPSKISELTKKKDQDSISETRSPKGKAKHPTVQKTSMEKTGNEETHQKGKPRRLEFEEMQLVCKNSNPVKYNTDHYKQQLEKMIENNNKNSLLSVSDHVIRFRQSSFMESCFHLDIYNPTQKHVLFRVERPKVPYLSVKPKIGFLAPGDSRTVYLLFSFRCPRLPDDLAFSYIIYQIPINSSDLPPLERDKKNYTTKKTRKLAKGATFEHRWTVGVAFYSGEGEADICPGPHLEGNPPQLDNKGKIFQDDYNPDEHGDDSENLPSACD